MSDRCIFCGWNRSNCYKDIKFFALPKEPGLKRLLWMHAVQKKVIKRHDKICSIHFRQGRPSNDPSHEDFIPHLFLNPEKTSSEVLSYLENEDMNDAPAPRKSNEKQDTSPPENDDTSANNKKPNILRGKRKCTTVITARILEPRLEAGVKKVCVVKKHVMLSTFSSPNLIIAKDSRNQKL